MDVSETEKVVLEFLATLEPGEKPSVVLIKMAEALLLQEEASQLIPLYIPPRPSTLQETTTAKEISSTTQPQATEPLSAATHEENAPSTSIAITNPPHAEIEYTVEKVMEEAEKVERAEKSAGEDVLADENVVGKEDVVDTAEGKDVNVAVDDDEQGNEGGAGDKPGKLC